MVLKKKQIIVSAMVLLIAGAGYLNWSYDANSDEIAFEKNDEYTPIGEAQMVFNDSSKSDKQYSENGKTEKTEKDKNNVNEANKTQKSEAKSFTVSQAKLDRDNKRSESISLLKTTLLETNTNDETKSAAQQKILNIADAMDKEQSVESMIAAKELGNSVVYICEDSVNVIVDLKDITASQATQIREIVYDFTKNNNIKIVELNK